MQPVLQALRPHINRASLYPFRFTNMKGRSMSYLLFMEDQDCACACMCRENHCIRSIRLTGGVGVSLTNNMTGTEVDTNGQIRSPRKTRTHGTCLPAVDQTWEDCNPERRHRDESAAESHDSRGMAENKERDGALAQNKRCQELALQGSSLSGMGEKH